MKLRLIYASALAFAVAACAAQPDGGVASSVAPVGNPLGSLPKIAEVDPRFQSYNIEMVEVTGGRFWAPYGGPADEMYRQRPPADLADPKLRALARHLGPSLMRVSGTWANNTYLPAEGETLAAPPEGYQQILTRDQWKGVIAFSKAVDAPIVTSFAASAGTRNAAGVWTTGQAQRIVELTQQAGGSLYAAEFFNEPNIPGATVGMPPSYDVADYAADFRIFRAWAKKAVPNMKILGTGGVSEGTMMRNPPAVIRGGKFLGSDSLLAANPGSLDGVSYHFYGTVSPRCKGPSSLDEARVSALSPAWLDRTLEDYAFYADLRDKHEPGKPIWNTETAQAACGGAPWASTFLDTFRYLNQNAALAQKGVKVVMHNTLAASDYALIDGDTLTPRPNYWAAVLWRRTMGTTVLASPRSPSPALRLYAQCLVGKPGGVAIMALNTGETQQRIDLGGKGLGWTMTGQPIETRNVLINGKSPALTKDSTLSGLEGAPINGEVAIPAQAVAFFAMADAANPACN